MRVDKSLAPIGVFDSGVGGLTVVAALRKRMPSQPLVYLGDTARLPYGTKSEDTVARYSQRNLDFLIDQGVQGVVIACNTATALAMPQLQAAVPLWGVVGPGAAEAASASAGRVGVLATESTVASGAYERALMSLRPDLLVWSRACPLFVPLVEEGWFEDPVTEQVARRYLEPLLEEGIDTLVLGCTHYPMLAKVLQQVAGPSVRLVNSAESVANRVARDLEVAGPASPQAEPSVSLQLFVTDSADRNARIAATILGEPEIRLDLVEVT